MRPSRARRIGYVIPTKELAGRIRPRYRAAPHAARARRGHRSRKCTPVREWLRPPLTPIFIYLNMFLQENQFRAGQNPAKVIFGKGRIWFPNRFPIATLENSILWQKIMISDRKITIPIGKAYFPIGKACCSIGKVHFTYGKAYICIGKLCVSYRKNMLSQ